VEALGLDNVTPVIMLDDKDSDSFAWAYFLCGFLKIKPQGFSVKDSVDGLLSLVARDVYASEQVRNNLLARTCTTILHVYADCMNGLVAGTYTPSEDFSITGDFNPVKDYVLHEIIEIGAALGLSYELFE